MSSTSEKRAPRKAGAFDIRTFIATLLGLYGVVLLLMGLFGTSDADLRKADGLNINLWGGIGILVAAVLLQAWAMWRPVVVPKDLDADTGVTGPMEEVDRETAERT